MNRDEATENVTGGWDGTPFQVPPDVWIAVLDTPDKIDRQQELLRYAADEIDAHGLSDHMSNDECVAGWLLIELRDAASTGKDTLA